MLKILIYRVEPNPSQVPLYCAETERIAVYGRTVEEAMYEWIKSYNRSKDYAIIFREDTTQIEDY